jgi:hypothetical protein
MAMTSTPFPTPTLSPISAEELQLIHQIQHHALSNGHTMLLGFAFMLPLSDKWKLAIYHFFISLPLPHLSDTWLTVIILGSPIVSLTILFLAFKFGGKLLSSLVPLIFSGFAQKTYEKIFLELTFPHDTSKSSYATEQLYSLLHTVSLKKGGIFYKKKTFSLEIVSTKNEGIRYIIGVPKQNLDVLYRSLLSYLPGLTVKEIPDYLSSFKLFTNSKNEESSEGEELEPVRTKTIGVVEFDLSNDSVLPLHSQKTLSQHDPMSFIVGNMTKLATGELVAYQIIIDSSISQPIKNHLSQIKQTIYHGQPLSDVLSKKSSVPLPGALLFVLSPLLWLVIVMARFAFKLPFLIFAPNGLESKSFYESSSKAPLDVTLGPYEQELATVVKEKLAQHLFTVSIRLLVVSDDEASFDARETGLVSAFSQFRSAYQSLVTKGTTSLPFLSVRSFKRRLGNFYNRRLSGSENILSSSELSDLYHFPNMDITKIEGLIKNKSSQLPVPTSIKRDNLNLDVIVGKNIYGGEETAVGLRKIDRKQHTYIIGKTGMGKSTIIEGMALQDIQNGYGVAVVDPHGDMVEHLLTLIPDSRKEDVVYINPFDKSFPTGLNILNPGISYPDVEEKHRRIAGTVLSIFMKITPEKHWGQRMEHVLRNAILTTLQIPQGTPETPYISLYTIQKLLTDASYRKRVISGLQDPILKQFWDKEFRLFGTHQQADLISPLTNKIGQFITDPLSRYILLQKESTINISEIMDEGRILLVNLSKGNLEEERSAFFGTTITALIQLATYARTQIPEAQRRDFFVYIDEFQNFATPHFTELFSEARKYHVFFTPTHQNIAQIDDPKVSKVIKGNSGNFIVLKGSPDDEESMLPLFSPEVEKGQLVNLAPHHFFMKVTNNESEDAFTGVTLPIIQEGSKEVSSRIKEYSRKKYATPKDEVERQLESILFHQSSPTPVKKPDKKPEPKTVSMSRLDLGNGLNKNGELKSIKVV